jgi:hypothetical protein
MGSRVPAVKMPPHVVRAHDEAVARGDDGYFDPDTGLFVMTATYLTERGYCCGSGCRHCPYAVDDEGEPVLIAAER